jgi:hypothetical protein
MKRYCWIAINGSSCACFPLLLKHVRTVPRPELLIGFPTVKEALAIQHKLLHAPVEVMQRTLRKIHQRTDLVKIRPVDPEPMTEAETMWVEADTPYEERPL